MKNLKKRSLSLLLLLTMVVTLTGCNQFDATAYIKACLDANTHGEFEEYAKITNSDVDSIKTQYESLLDEEISYLSAYKATDEQKAKFRELFANIYKSFKYEVGEATKNSDGTYSVPVTTYKLMVFKDVMSEGETYITDYVTEQTEAGKSLTEEDLYPVIIDFMYETMSKNFEAAEYGDAVSVDVTVGPMNGNSKVYGISQTELQSLLENFIDLENAQ